MKALDRMLIVARKMTGVFSTVAFISQSEVTGKYTARLDLCGRERGSNRIMSEHDTLEEAHAAIDAALETYPPKYEPLVVFEDDLPDESETIYIFIDRRRDGWWVLAPCSNRRYDSLDKAQAEAAKQVTRVLHHNAVIVPIHTLGGVNDETA